MKTLGEFLFKFVYNRYLVAKKYERENTFSDSLFSSYMFILSILVIGTMTNSLWLFDFNFFDVGVDVLYKRIFAYLVFPIVIFLFAYLMIKWRKKHFIVLLKAYEREEKSLKKKDKRQIAIFYICLLGYFFLPAILFLIDIVGSGSG